MPVFFFRFSFAFLYFSKKYTHEGNLNNQGHTRVRHIRKIAIIQRGGHTRSHNQRSGNKAAKIPLFHLYITCTIPPPFHRRFDDLHRFITASMFLYAYIETRSNSPTEPLWNGNRRLFLYTHTHSRFIYTYTYFNL